jgi:two-component system sensor histidine kinase/response regulator
MRSGDGDADAGARRGVVAVVDDDEDIRAFVAVVLEMAGYTPLADDGSEGVAERLAAARPVLVLLDLNLDGRHGTQVLAELRARPGLRGVPVAAFTAAAGPADAERVRAAGFDAHVVKPVEPEVLVARAETMIAAAGERRRAAAEAVPVLEHASPGSPDGGGGKTENEGEDDYLAGLRTRFRAALPQRLAAMREAVEGGDAETLTRDAHKLRGAAAGYGFQPLADLAMEAEEALRAGAAPSHPAVRTLLERLESEPAE